MPIFNYTIAYDRGNREPLFHEDFSGSIKILARNHSGKVLRLDTGKQNIPAVSLYKKLGFQIVATPSMKVGAAIEHSGHLFFEKVRGCLEAISPEAAATWKLLRRTM